MEDRWLEAHISLCVTVALGAYFTGLQAIEYLIASFSMRDGVYGRTFYVATGFHGLHVIIGTTFIAVILYRNMFLHFSAGHHFGFEARAWYWHFVDVVWLFLFMCIYWWGYYLRKQRSGVHTSRKGNSPTGICFSRTPARPQHHGGDTS